MTEVDREALMLTVWDGLGHRDAAKVAGCSVGAFAVRLHRARRRLHEELARLDEGDGPTIRIEAWEAS
jgi:RNA polymerase sigma-70 factor (ECF subfamily)